jgi:hypothetical protein
MSFDLPAGMDPALLAKAKAAAAPLKPSGAKFGVGEMVTVRVKNPAWSGSQSDLQQGIPETIPGGEGAITAVKVYSDYGYVVNGKQYADWELTKKTGGRRHTRGRRRRASRRGFRV